VTGARTGAAPRTCALLALSCCCAAAPAASARAASARIHPALAPAAPGVRTAFTFAYSLQDTEAGVPPPLRSVVVHLPLGLGLDLGGAATCAPARVRRSGPSGCPQRSLIGRGHAVLEVHAGSQSIPEEAVVWAIRVPDRGGHSALAIFGRGETPLVQQSTSMATVLPDRPPYGSMLSVSVPAIPTVVYEPDASVISFSMTLGGPRAHAGGVTLPRRCPAGGLPFAAGFTFADQTRALAAAHLPCPRRG